MKRYCCNQICYSTFTIIAALAASTILAAHPATSSFGSAQNVTATPPPVTTSATVDRHYAAAHLPAYPAEAVKRHQQGNVVVKVRVSPEGQPTQVTVDQDATHAAHSLAAATVKAANHWRYNPRAEGGKAVVGWVRVPVIFRITKATGAKKKGRVCLGEPLPPPEQHPSDRASGHALGCSDICGPSVENATAPSTSEAPARASTEAAQPDRA